MFVRRARWGVALGLALLPAVLAGPAIAEPTREDRAAALALFDEGRKLAGAKKYAEACPKFEAAMRLDPGIGTLFNLSDCYEQIGRTASAWSGFRDVAAQAKAAGQAEREKVARERAAALEGKLSRVRLVAPPDLAGAALTISRDGSPMPASLVGTAFPLDPGPHTFRISADGKEPWETKIDLPADGKTLDVQVPALAPKTGGPTTTAPAGTTTAPAGTTAPDPTSTTAATTAPSGTPDTASPRPWQMPLGVAATALGVVAGGVGAAFAFIAKGTNDKSNEELCTAGTPKCINQEGVDLRNEALMQAHTSTGLIVAGSVIGAAGIVLWVTAPASSPKSATSSRSLPRAPSASVSDVRVSASPGGVVVRGRF